MLLSSNRRKEWSKKDRLSVYEARARPFSGLPAFALLIVMPAAPPVPAALAHAFATARYVIHAPTGAITLSIGQACPELDALMREYRASTLAILTAFNPGARACKEAANQAAQAALLHAAQALGLPMLIGHNAAGTSPPRHGESRTDLQAQPTPAPTSTPAPAPVSTPAPQDHIEPTVAILGISRRQASALAHAYGQRAWVFAGSDAVPRLMWEY